MLSHRVAVAPIVLWLCACTGAIPQSSDDGADSGVIEIDAAVGDAVRAAVGDARGGSDSDAALPPDNALATAAGCFFTVNNANAEHAVAFGEAGVAYKRLQIDYDVIHGGWREDVFDRPVLNHGLVGLRRNVSAFVGRYILGNAAQIKPAQAGLQRKSVFYGRVDLEPRPGGEGWMGYTAWRGDFAWVVGETYHIRIVLNAITERQILTISGGGGGVTTTGDIPYWEPALSGSTFTLDFGGTESNEREVKAIGWEFCNLVVRGDVI